MAAPTNGQCRVLLVEDDAPVRARLAHIIADWPEGHLVAACATLGEVLTQIATTPVDLLVSDLQLPDGNGIEAIRRLRQEQPKAEAMVISALGDHETVIAAIEAGATGFLLKDAEPFDMIEAIKELLAGGSPVSSAIARTIIRRIKPETPAPVDTKTNKTSGPVQKLTRRETEILQGVAKGLTYAELADVYGISHQTVPVHIRNIYRKLETHNRSETVYEAMRLGLIERP
ncbi:MAG: response regulator transcription factor [Magnetovibrio sp.]|nr:response regulator transcription factor [Magnetovibrio sp.]